MPLPPWMRRYQQTWYWQNFVMPLLVGFLGSLILQGCLKDVFHISMSCVQAATNGCILSLVTAWVKGHSTGSVSFNPDGTPNDTVQKVVAMQKTDPQVVARMADLAKVAVSMVTPPPIK